MGTLPYGAASPSRAGQSSQESQRGNAVNANQGQWTFGLSWGIPELTGFYGDYSYYWTQFDLESDLDLKPDQMGLGFYMEYSGPRFGICLDYAVQDYAGKNRLDRSINIGGNSFLAGMDLTSSIQNAAFEANGTIKALRWPQAWLGLDLGIQAWYLEVKASGVAAPPWSVSEESNETNVVPIPQIGVSGCIHALKGDLVLSGKAHFMALNGASYARFAADARYYLLPWLGLRAFWETQHLDAPLGSIKNHIELKLDRVGIGFGAVARW